LGDTLLALGQPAQARDELKKLEDTGYQPGQTALLLGISAEREKQYDLALDYFRKAQEDPDLAQEAKLHQGQVLAAKRQWKESQKVLEEAVKLAPRPLQPDRPSAMATLETQAERLRPSTLSAAS
jgi:tetratricopeptide (TPR) repeat protein